MRSILYVALAIFAQALFFGSVYAITLFTHLIATLVAGLSAKLYDLFHK